MIQEIIPGLHASLDQAVRIAYLVQRLARSVASVTGIGIRVIPVFAGGRMRIHRRSCWWVKCSDGHRGSPETAVAIGSESYLRWNRQLDCARLRRTPTLESNCSAPTGSGPRIARPKK